MIKRLFMAALAVVCIVCSSCGNSNGDNVAENQNNGQNVGQTEIEADKSNGDSEQGKTDEEIKAEAQRVKELSKKSVEIFKKVPEYPEGYPTLKDAAALYEKANMAIGWIISTEPMAVYDDISITVDGFEYKKVRPDCFYGKHNLEHHATQLGETQKLIFDLDSLEAYIGTIINPEEVREYMEDAEDLKKFAEDEAGNLYVLPFSYTAEGFGKESYTLDDNGDGTYTFNVAYTLVDENGEIYKERTESFDLVQIDGRWVFDDFRVIRQN